MSRSARIVRPSYATFEALARSFIIHRYSYPKQETSLRDGETFAIAEARRSVEAISLEERSGCPMYLGQRCYRLAERLADIRFRELNEFIQSARAG